MVVPLPAHCVQTSCTQLLALNAASTLATVLVWLIDFFQAPVFFEVVVFFWFSEPPPIVHASIHTHQTQSFATRIDGLPTKLSQLGRHSAVSASSLSTPSPQRGMHCAHTKTHAHVFCNTITCTSSCLQPRGLAPHRGRQLAEPVVAFGPPGTTGEENISVIVAPIQPGFQCVHLGGCSHAHPM